MQDEFIDRAAHLRKDAAFLANLLVDPRVRLVPVWRGRCLVRGRPARALLPRIDEEPALLEAAEDVVFLGLIEGVPHLLLNMPKSDAPPPVTAGVFLDFFVAGGQLPPDERSLLAYARGMALWHDAAGFDPTSGAPTRAVEGGFARQAEGGDRLFPRTDPAVMVLVTHGERCLLARGHHFPPQMLSALAGFVEPGETLEGCVRRETREEVGLEVNDLRYFGSQPWPFPRSLMIGFFAATDDPTALSLDDEELESARWVTRAELRHPKDFFYPPPFSLAHHMIRAWIDA